jgi:hypothetical protein
MIYNILNGDALAYSFAAATIEGDIIVMREALIEGDVAANSLQALWHARANHFGISSTEYYNKSVTEFEKIINATEGSEFNLWFEYDLFCQVNMWFVMSLINCLPINKKVYAVYTSYLHRTDAHFWNGFGPAEAAQLQVCFADRILFTETDLQLGQQLWTAYKDNNFTALMQLAKNKTAAFPYLQEVVTAHVERFPKDGTTGRPERVIEDIIKNIATDFATVFKEFWKRESIYGFGDTQLKHIYNKVMSQRTH